jgi:hypothetical protein
MISASEALLDDLRLIASAIPHLPADFEAKLGGLIKAIEAFLGVKQRLSRAIKEFRSCWPKGRKGVWIKALKRIAKYMSLSQSTLYRVISGTQTPKLTPFSKEHSDQNGAHVLSVDLAPATTLYRQAVKANAAQELESRSQVEPLDDVLERVVGILERRFPPGSLNRQAELERSLNRIAHLLDD